MSDSGDSDPDVPQPLSANRQCHLAFYIIAWRSGEVAVARDKLASSLFARQSVIFADRYRNHKGIILWIRRSKVNRLVALPTRRFSTHHYHRHIPATIIQSNGNGREALSVQHYIDHPFHMLLIG